MRAPPLIVEVRAHLDRPQDTSKRDAAAKAIAALTATPWRALPRRRFHHFPLMRSPSNVQTTLSLTA